MICNLLETISTNCQSFITNTKSFFYCALLMSLLSFSQSKISDQKVFLITLDGLRWQELFLGADSLLVKNKNYVKHPEKL